MKKHPVTTTCFMIPLFCSLLFLSFILSLVPARPLQASEKDRIYWFVIHWPPIMTLNASKTVVTGGEYKAKLALLQQFLPQYDHHNVDMPWNRFWSMVKDGDHVCNCMVYKNEEREKIAEYSIPVSIILPDQIVMRRETIEKMNNPASLSLTELMQDNQLTGLLIAKRSYSHDIDDILKKYESSSNITRAIVNEETSLKMLANKRMDYILEYPFVVNHTVENDLPEYKDRFGYVPIKEVAPFYYVYTACPKNQWGKSLISLINTALERLRPTDDFRNELKNLYEGEQLRQALEYYDKELLHDIRRGQEAQPDD